MRKDAMVLASDSKTIITHNIDDFKSASNFNVKIYKPGEFLKIMKGSKNE